MCFLNCLSWVCCNAAWSQGGNGGATFRGKKRMVYMTSACLSWGDCSGNTQQARQMLRASSMLLCSLHFTAASDAVHASSHIMQRLRHRRGNFTATLTDCCKHETDACNLSITIYAMLQHQKQFKDGEREEACCQTWCWLKSQT